MNNKNIIVQKGNMLGRNTVLAESSLVQSAIADCIWSRTIDVFITIYIDRNIGTSEVIVAQSGLRENPVDSIETARKLMKKLRSDTEHCTFKDVTDKGEL